MKKDKLESPLAGRSANDQVLPFDFLQLPPVVFKNIFSHLPVRERFRSARVCHAFRDMMSHSGMYSDMKACDLGELFDKDNANLGLSFLPTGVRRISKALDILGPAVCDLTVMTGAQAVVSVLSFFPNLCRLKLTYIHDNDDASVSLYSSLKLLAASCCCFTQLQVSDLDIIYLATGTEFFFKKALPSLFDVNKVRQLSLHLHLSDLDASKLGLEAFTNLESLQLDPLTTPKCAAEFGWHLLPATLRELDVPVLKIDVPNLSRFRCLEKLKLWVCDAAAAADEADVIMEDNEEDEANEEYDDEEAEEVGEEEHGVGEHDNGEDADMEEVGQGEEEYDDDDGDNRFDEVLTSISKMLIYNVHSLTCLGIGFDYHLNVKINQQLVEALTRMRLVEFQACNLKISSARFELLLTKLFDPGTGCLKHFQFDTMFPGGHTLSILLKKRI